MTDRTKSPNELGFEQGFAAGREAALAEVTRFAGHDTTRLLVQRIRALKPAPRSPEHAAEPSAQGERSLSVMHSDVVTAIQQGYHGDDLIARITRIMRPDVYPQTRATAPSTSIEAEPVAWQFRAVIGGEPTGWLPCESLAAANKLRTTVGYEVRELFAAPPDRTPDARPVIDQYTCPLCDWTGKLPNGNACRHESTDARSTSDAAVVVTDAMVTRFLSWQLPKTFSPDCGINFDGRKDDEWNKNKSWPVGTNLFTADEARAMLEHVLAAQPPKATPGGAT